MKSNGLNRRVFLQRSLVLAAGTPLVPRLGTLFANESAPRAGASVAVVSCTRYDAEVRTAMQKGFDLIGGIGGLVKDKTVTVKINLTGTNFSDYMGRPVGETYMTHYSTALALAALAFGAGAKRVRFVESTQSKSALETSLGFANWDLQALAALGKVEFENTRNLGLSKNYARLPVTGGGYMFSALDLNHSYADTDVMISLAKLKNHITAGVTLSMKNLFGLTPNALYSDQAGNEEATAGRTILHTSKGYEHIKPPGLKAGISSADPTWRVPRIVADICAARPIDLAIIDGITSMSGGEGPWCSDAGTLKFQAPGVLIVGRNPVSTDAVGTAIMGYADPRAVRGTKPFTVCDNHLLLAEQAGLGTADLKRIEVRGLTVEKARHPFG
jgi:uncharacterized protein (DUF362 family)